jgi:hypothetical protein
MIGCGKGFPQERLKLSEPGSVSPVLLAGGFPLMIEQNGGAKPRRSFYCKLLVRESLPRKQNRWADKLASARWLC